MNIIMALPPTDSVDAEKHVVNLSDELLHRGHSVYIVADTLNRDSETEHIAFTFEYSGFTGLMRSTRALQRLIKDVKADIVHAHAPDRITYRTARKLKLPLVTTLHDYPSAISFKKALDLCGDRTFAAWEQVKTRAVEEGGPASNLIEIMHLGLDSDHFAPRALRKNSPRPIVSLVGDLTGAEGDAALKMMQEVFEFDWYNVRVVGTDYLPAEFSEFESKIELVGRNEDYRSHLSESDVVIASGSTAAEALMMGRPLVAVGPARALGLIDEDNIAAAIACAFGRLDDKSHIRCDYEAIRNEIGQGIARRYVSDEVHETVLKEFNLKEAADRIEKTYEELISGEKK